MLGPGHTACKPSLDPRSLQLFSSCLSTSPSAPQALAVPSGSQEKAETSLVTAGECGCPEGSPPALQRTPGSLLTLHGLSQQPGLPGLFPGASGQEDES